MHLNLQRDHSDSWQNCDTRTESSFSILHSTKICAGKRYFCNGQTLRYMSTKLNVYPIYSNSDDEDNDESKMKGRQSRLSNIYDEMFLDNHKDQNINQHKNEQVDETDNNNNQQEDQYTDYIDYIASYHDSQLNENKNDESLIQQLFEDDYPSTLPLPSQQQLHQPKAKREKTQRNDNFSGNEKPSSYQNDKYSNTYRSQQPKHVPSPPPHTHALSPSPPPRASPPNHFEYNEEIKKLNTQIPKNVPSSPLPPRASPIKPTPSISEYNETISEQTIFTSSSIAPQPNKESSNNPIYNNLQTTEKEYIQFNIQQIQYQLYKHNDNEAFNIHSHKQVSKLLFGVDNESTNRDVLEGLMGNLQPIEITDRRSKKTNTKNLSEMAKLILEFRRLNSKLKKIEREEKHKSNGTHVNHGGDVAFVATSTGGSSYNNNNKNTFVPNELTLGHQYYQQNDNNNDKNDSSNSNAIIEPLVLIDASAYIFRAYYSMPPIHRSDGEPTGATLGFCNMLNRLIVTPSFLKHQLQTEDTKTEFLPPRIVLVFDSKDGTNFRKKLYPEYKANRKSCPEDLIPQFDHVRDAADAYGILQLEAAGYEADDVIATIATRALEEGCFVNILSGDKDLMQLVTQDKVLGGENDGDFSIKSSSSSLLPCIQLIEPMNMVRVDYDGVIDKWGVQPELLGDVLALAGDVSDNIPGVPGIGPKIAACLIREFGSLNGLLENVDSVKQKGRREKLKESVELVRLMTGEGVMPSLYSILAIIFLQINTYVLIFFFHYKGIIIQETS